MRDGTFLQTAAWEEFQQQVGHTTQRIDDILIVDHTTPLGAYWYIGRAQLDTGQVNKITQAAKQSKVLFIRIDPLKAVPLTPYPSRLTSSTQPQTTLVLDLTPSEDILLSTLHEKTRYNIHLAERKGVVIEESSDPEHRNFRSFIELGRKTGSRHGIRFHSEQYYRQMLESLQVEGLTSSIVVAYKDDQPLAANLMVWADDTTYYLHGASNHEYRQLMAPHLLQWACIQKAKERGATVYDFWGIAPAASSSQLLASRRTHGEKPESLNLKAESYAFDPSHPWAGITRFKLGFGGKVVSYPDSVDLVLDPTRYRIYQIGRALRHTLGRVV